MSEEEDSLLGATPKLTPLETLRHSTAHVMASAVQKLFPGTKVTIGPHIETGFYYDFDRKEPFTEADLAKIEAEMQKICLLYTSDAADERSSVDLGGRRII